MLLESEKISLGSSAPAVSLKGVDDEMHALEEFENAKVLVIVFMCNHCPYVQAVWGRLVELQAEFEGRGVQFVGINSNNHPDYPEDNMENMKKYYEKHEMNFPYLLDENQKVARAYGAVCTPDIFVYDGERKLAYHGRIDDNWKDENLVTERELANALDALVRGERPYEKQNPSIGCSIKWIN